MAKIRKKPKKSINKNINKNRSHKSTPNIAEKTRQRDGCVPGYGILNIPDKRWTAGQACVGWVCSLWEEFEEVTRFHSIFMQKTNCMTGSRR